MSQVQPSRLAEYGKIFFRYRDYTPIPLILIVLIAANTALFSSVVGLLVILLGEIIRFYGVMFIGSISRTRTEALGAKLIDQGPFAVVRNPLYVGNFFISLGIVFLSGVNWLGPIFLILFFVQYQSIVAWEENHLRKEFGEAYSKYCQTVPRWIPSYSSVVQMVSEFDWTILQNQAIVRATLHSERNTLLAIGAIITMIFLRG